MKMKMLCGIAPFAAIFPILCLVASGSDQKPLPTAPAKSVAAPQKTKRALEKGMSAEAIIELIGKPASVSPMQTAEGKAETWTYRRLADEQVYQSADSQTSIPAFIGFNANGPMLGDTVMPVYRLKHQRTYQVTSLLMFDGKLVLAKQWREREESYAD